MGCRWRSSHIGEDEKGYESSSRPTAAAETSMEGPPAAEDDEEDPPSQANGDPQRTPATLVELGACRPRDGSGDSEKSTVSPYMRIHTPGTGVET